MKFSASQLVMASLAIGQVSAAPSAGAVMKRSPAPAVKNGRFHINEETSFANQAVFTFDNGLPDGLQVSNYPAGETHSFVPDNAVVQDGYLQLKVNGGQTAMPYLSGEVATTVTNIKFASVRTVAILSDPAGVCNGMFFYKSDTQETDIEWLSDPESQSNGGTRKIWFTNQDANGDGKSTHQDVEPPADPTNTEHEYRIDWTDGRVQFFIDGAQLWETSEDVPSVPGPWLWNNWSNGDKGWSAGPPADDAYFKIKKIEMYYDTA